VKDNPTDHYITPSDGNGCFHSQDMCQNMLKLWKV